MHHLGFVFSITILQVVQYSNKYAPKPSFLLTEQAWFLQPKLVHPVLQSSDHLLALH